MGSATCDPCAQAHCCAELKTCLGMEGKECESILDCVLVCSATNGGEDCTKNCLLTYPKGFMPFSTLAVCLEANCQESCGSGASDAGSDALPQDGGAAGSDAPEDVTAESDASPESGDDAISELSDTLSDDVANAEDSAPKSCTKEPDCGGCCVLKHPAAHLEFLKLLQPCGCKEGVCEAQCAATFCTDPAKYEPLACTQCLESALAPSGFCAKGVLSECLANANCEPFMKCVSECPEPDGGKGD
ncbi:hypothetical protein EPN90_01895 [Patescibacteria group bacterium]|nr:MAG: hypothetical protein EPN90_01895 [Patescibacteria group bacterium]